jgi:uncharacterized OB-fold protein
MIESDQPEPVSPAGRRYIRGLLSGRIRSDQEGRGPLHLVYQDAFRSLAFYGEEVRTVEVPDLGTVVSVTIVETVDTGYTSFSLPVADVELPTDQSSVFMHTEGITTVHRIFVALIGHPQSETYTVTPLNGTAAGGPLPL